MNAQHRSENNVLRRRKKIARHIEKLLVLLAPLALLVPADCIAALTVDANITGYDAIGIKTSFDGTDPTETTNGARFFLDIPPDQSSALPTTADGKYVAMCVEPFESTQTGWKKLEVTGLESAPTHVDGMSQDAANAIERVLTQVAKPFAELTATELAAMQMILWEVGTEIESNYDIATGQTRLAKDAAADELAQQWLVFGNQVGVADEVDTLALLNYGNGNDNSQDMIVFWPTPPPPSLPGGSIPTPAPLALLALGFVAMATVRGKKRHSSIVAPQMPTQD